MSRRVFALLLLAGVEAALAGCFAFDWAYRGSASGSSSSSGGAPTTSSSSSGAGGAERLTTPFFGEGSRLKADYWDYGDGAKQFVGWFDTKLGLPCTFEPFATGDVACVPAFGPVTYFADAACTEPLVTVFPSGACPAASYGAVSNTMRSCATPQSFGTPGTTGFDSIEEAKDTFTGSVYISNGGSCTMEPASGLTFKRVGPPIALSTTFVTATIEKQARGAHLFEQVYAGSDGSWQLDRTLDDVGPCTIRTSGDAVICESIFTAYIDSDPFYTDATCTTLLTPDVALVQKDLCKPPQFVRYTKTDAKGCPQPQTYFDVGSAESLPPLWYSDLGTCYAFTTTSLNGLSVGAARPLSAFPQPKLETLGTGRVQGSFYGASATEALGPPISFTDTTRSTTCQPVMFDDGVARCIDSSVSAPYYFGDAACTVPIIVYTPNTCVPGATPSYGLTPSAMPVCAVPRAKGVAKLVSAPALAYSKQATSCQPQTLAPGAQVFTLGAEISLAGFATVALVEH